MSWDGVYDPVESAISELQAENPHIPPQEIAEIVTSQVAAFLAQTPWTMLEVNPWEVIDLDQIGNLEQAYIIAEDWTRHDPGGPGGGSGSRDSRRSGGVDGTGRDTVSDGAGGALPDADGNGQADSDFDNNTGSGTYGGGGDPFVDSVENGNMGDTGSGSPVVSPDQPPGAFPVILDLDGDGVEVNASARVNFDWDGDGFLESGNWAACNRSARQGLWRAAA